MVNVTINGMKVSVPEGSTILQAAQQSRYLYSYSVLSP